ncbi:MAG: DUF5977 domain-containing protein [Chitinophagaceae bacterium]
MALQHISGSLTIPSNEPSTSGIYNDLTIYLIGIKEGIQSVLITDTTVETSNTYEFSYDDTLVDNVIVQLKRTSSDYLLTESWIRGVLPRSFLLEANDILANTDFVHQNYLFDAGLSVLATAKNAEDLSKEITVGITQSEMAGYLPFHVNHIIPNPSGATQEIRTSTVAIVAYSLGYYLEHNPEATNKVEVADALNNMLLWLCEQRNPGYENLLTAGRGRYVNDVFDEDYIDQSANTVDNILAFFAFKQAGVILNSIYLQVAERLSQAIRTKLYDNQNRKFHTALFPNGGLNTGESLELYYLATLFFIETNDIPRATDMLDIHVEYDYQIVDTSNGVTAYKANKNDTGVYYEGSYAVAMCYYKLNNTVKYSQLTKQLNKLLNEDGSYRFGTIKDGKKQVLCYKSVGSTAWGYMSNLHPGEVFTVNMNTELITDVPKVYINGYQSQVFYNSTCSSGSIAQPITYEILPGTYSSMIDQETADQMALDQIEAEGQLFADANGTCSTSYQYYNTERKGLFTANCPPNSNSQAFEYSIPAGAYGSDLSPQHANALADKRLFELGQQYANANGVCAASTRIVPITQESTYSFNGIDQDEIYAVVKANEPVNTNLVITYDYTLNQGVTWITGGTAQMYPGTQQTNSFYVDSVYVGGGPSCYIRVTDVTPATSGLQIYQWNNNVTLFSNELRSAYFIKDCPLLSAASVVLFSCSAGLFSSHISQDHANSLADRYLASNGHAYANNHGTCGGIVLYGNEPQSQLFTRNNCPSGYQGTQLLYTVPANTYQSTVSIAAANALAMGDIASIGQNWVNANATCELVNTNVFIQLILEVISYGVFDQLRVMAQASSPVPVDISIDYSVHIDGNQNVTNPLVIPAGLSSTPYEIVSTGISPGQGQNSSVTITGIYPSSSGGITFIHS